MNTSKLYTGTITVILLAFSLNGFAQSQTNGDVFYPGVMDPGRISTAIGFSVSQLPRDVVGETASQLPMLRMDSRLGVPGGFSADISVSSIYITNTVTVGGAWSGEYDELSLSVGAQLTYWFGVAKLDAFNASAKGLMVTPYVAGGIDLGLCKVVVRGELYFAQNSKAIVGSTCINCLRAGVSGVSVSTSLQKELYGNVEILIGARIQYSQPDHETWIAFPNPNRWNVTPKLLFGYVL